MGENQAPPLFSCENRDEANHAFMTRTGVEVRPMLAKVTMPLVTDRNGLPRVAATGVLLHIQGLYFIITVAHVFDEVKAKKLPLLVTDGVRGNSFIPLGAVTLRRSVTADPGERKDDPYDICVCEIAPGLAGLILSGGNFRFLGLRQVDPWDGQEPRSWYTVFGFPGALSPPDPSGNTFAPIPCAFASFLYCDERGKVTLGYYDAEVGILLDYHPSNTRNDQGILAPPPIPHGMSGAGIWRIAQTGINPKAWSLNDLKLVAIQNSVDGQRQILAGTRIMFALQFIYRNYLELRAEMERNFGRAVCRRLLG